MNLYKCYLLVDGEVWRTFNYYSKSYLPQSYYLNKNEIKKMSKKGFKIIIIDKY